MPKRDRAEYMRSYRLRRKLAAVEGPDAAWRRMHPSAALVELARALPDMEPDDGEGIIAPRAPAPSPRPMPTGAALAPHGPRSSWLTMNIAASIAPGVRAGRAGQLVSRSASTFNTISVTSSSTAAAPLESRPRCCRASCTHRADQLGDFPPLRSIASRV